MSNRKFNCNDENKQTIDKFLTEYKAGKGKGNYSDETIDTYEKTIRKLSDYLEKHTKHKSLDKPPSKEEMINFFNNNKYVTSGSHNITGTLLIRFYRWIYDYDKHTRPDNLNFFEQTSKRTKKRLRDPKRKINLIIEPKEYNTILEYSKDRIGRNKAIWETYYLSGFRPEELESMNIEDVEEDKDTNIVSVSCPESKTWPRTIDLTEYPENLITYKENHPDKNNKKSPLFIQFRKSSIIKRLSISQIQKEFREIRKNTDIKNTLEIKSFRKTRFTIMSGTREIRKDQKIGGLIFSDPQLSEYFGWELETIAKRRKEYDLSANKEMKRIILSKPIKSISYTTLSKEGKTKDETIKKQNNLLKKQSDLIEDQKVVMETNRDSYKDLKYENNEIMNTLSDFMNAHIFVIEKRDLLITKFKTSRDQRPETLINIGINEYNKYKKTNKKPIKNVKDFKKVTNEYTQKNITSILKDPQFNKSIYK